MPPYENENTNNKANKYIIPTEQMLMEKHNIICKKILRLKRF